MLFHLAHPTCYAKLHFGFESALRICNRAATLMTATRDYSVEQGMQQLA